MIRSLRKGTSSVYLQHSNTGHEINAEKFECEIENRKLILNITLKPAGSNQKLDEEMIHREKLVSIELDDEKIITGLLEYINHHNNDIDNIKIQLISRGVIKSYETEIDNDRYEKTENLCFKIIDN